MTKHIPTPEEMRLTLEKEELIKTIRLLKAENEKLDLSLKSKIKITRKIKKRVGLKYFPAVVLHLIATIDKGRYSNYCDLYVKYMSLINYAIVAGIGVLINMFVIYALVNTMPLFMANGIAILVAFFWNWTFSVGPLGYFMGLQPEITEEETIDD